ncbi:MAG: bifunctional hydroxymethylpyrimidine kinase/phosphomethylpyrimidine kinase, partial [Clostridia bacterium]
IYTGYIGSAKQIDYIEDIINSCLNENGQVIIDPVMGDLGKFYSGFDMNYAKKMRGFCGKADIIMPNLTEASFLLDIPYIGENYDKSYIDEILIKLSNLGAKKVVLTGVSFNKDELGVAIYDTTSKSTNYCFNKKINKSFHGTGDLFASSLVGAIANDVHILEAVKIATEFVFEAISATMENYDTDHWYGVRFEKALPYLMRKLNK